MNATQDFLLRGGAAGTDGMIQAVADGPVYLYHNGVISLYTQTYNTSGNTSSIALRDHANNYRDAGYNDMRQIPLSGSSTITLDDEHCGALIYRTGTGADTVNMQSSSTVFQANSTVVIMNAGTSGTLTIGANAQTLNWVDGTGGAPSTGNRTLARNGICTVWRQTTGVYYVWGTGIT